MALDQEDVQFIGTAETARILSLTHETVIKFIREGTLKASKLPSGRYRIRLEDIEAMLEPVVTQEAINDN